MTSHTSVKLRCEWCFENPKSVNPEVVYYAVCMFFILHRDAKARISVSTCIDLCPSLAKPHAVYWVEINKQISTHLGLEKFSIPLLNTKLGREVFT